MKFDRVTLILESEGHRETFAVGPDPDELNAPLFAAIRQALADIEAREKRGAAT